MDVDLLKMRVSEIQWFHSIDLGNNVVTPGVDDSPQKLIYINLPEDLSNQSVLDIGAWDGFFSFEAERRGAKRVLATDSFCWSGKTWGSKNGFELAREALGSLVEDRLIDVMDISPEDVGSYDYVLFLGVLYHLRHPLLALEKAASVTKKCLILETVVDLVGLNQPAMAFYPNLELNSDPSNWWAPNPPALLSMLKSVGFSRVEVVCPPKTFIHRIARAIYLLFTKGKNPFVEYRRDRIVVHAWR